MTLDFLPRVRQALADRRPVVALETTVVTHGLDWPENLETALAMEQAIEDAGGCPATLGIVGGRTTIGLDSAQLDQFARHPAATAKCSRRDLPALIARRGHGSLTVAGTMQVAAMAGIDLMATGGIGGVHRGHPYDVSADLDELGRSPVAVVCAGIKSILDLPLTLEVLESRGVPVVGIGCDTLPAFFYRDSGLPLPASVGDPIEAAGVLRAWRDLQAGNGLLMATPVPETAALSEDEAEAAIGRAVRDADASGVHGSAVTPFVLRRVAEITAGRSVAANRALLVNNAATAAELACAAAD